MKKIKAGYIITVLALLAAACLSSCSAKQQSTESKGYKTPEKAISAYLDGFKKMDLEQMMGTFAMDTYVANQDFEGCIERINAYTYNMEIKLPNATTLATDLNIESRRANVSSAILRQYVALSSPGFDLLEMQALKTEGEAKKFADNFTRKLEDIETDSIKLLGFIPPEELSEYYAMDKNKENMAKIAEINGADELESRAAVVEIDGEVYLMCFEAANYGGSWYLQELGGNIGLLLGIGSLQGGLVPLSGIDIDWEEMMVPVS